MVKGNTGVHCGTMEEEEENPKGFLNKQKPIKPKEVTFLGEGLKKVTV